MRFATPLCSAIDMLRYVYLSNTTNGGTARSEYDGTRWRTGGEVKGKYANGVGSQQSCTISEDGLSSITTADAHTLAASS